jgi:ParB-like chromosome segregation protein Spo0J
VSTPSNEKSPLGGTGGASQPMTNTRGVSIAQPGPDSPVTAAVRFQALPPLSPDEYQTLEQSILTHGILVPIVVDEHDVVIDGHHRQKIAKHHNLPCPREVKPSFTDAEKRTMALSLNIDRRHLTREQRRALVAESVKADPQLSDREHARRTGVSDKTAGAVRHELETNAEIPHSPERTTADGKPAPGPKPKPPAPQPEPPQPRAKPRRGPITDEFAKSGLELDRTTARLRRLVADDRFARNRDELAARHRGDLMRYRDALDEIIGQLEGRPYASELEPGEPLATFKSRHNSKRQLKMIERTVPTLDATAEALEIVFPAGVFEKTFTPSVAGRHIDDLRHSIARIDRMVDRIALHSLDPAVVAGVVNEIIEQSQATP